MAGACVWCNRSRKKQLEFDAETAAMRRAAEIGLSGSMWCGVSSGTPKAAQLMAITQSMLRKSLGYHN
jgi:hypothetical protein